MALAYFANFRKRFPCCSLWNNPLYTVQEKVAKDTNFLWGPLFAALVNLIIIPQWLKWENYTPKQTYVDIYIYVCVSMDVGVYLGVCICVYSYL